MKEEIEFLEAGEDGLLVQLCELRAFLAEEDPEARQETLGHIKRVLEFCKPQLNRLFQSVVLPTFAAKTHRKFTPLVHSATPPPPETKYDVSAEDEFGLTLLHYAALCPSALNSLDMQLRSHPAQRLHKWLSPAPAPLAKDSRRPASPEQGTKTERGTAPVSISAQIREFQERLQAELAGGKAPTARQVSSAIRSGTHGASEQLASPQPASVLASEQQTRTFAPQLASARQQHPVSESKGKRKFDPDSAPLSPQQRPQSPLFSKSSKRERQKLRRKQKQLAICGLCERAGGLLEGPFTAPFGERNVHRLCAAACLVGGALDEHAVVAALVAADRERQRQIRQQSKQSKQPKQPERQERQERQEQPKQRPPQPPPQPPQHLPQSLPQSLPRFTPQYHLPQIHLPQPPQWPPRQLPQQLPQKWPPQQNQTTDANLNSWKTSEVLAVPIPPCRSVSFGQHPSLTDSFLAPLAPPTASADACLAPFPAAAINNATFLTPMTPASNNASFLTPVTPTVDTVFSARSTPFPTSIPPAPAVMNNFVPASCISVPPAANVSFSASVAASSSVSTSSPASAIDTTFCDAFPPTVAVPSLTADASFAINTAPSHSPITNTDRKSVV